MGDSDRIAWGSLGIWYFTWILERQYQFFFFSFRNGLNTISWESDYLDCSGWCLSSLSWRSSNSAYQNSTTWYTKILKNIVILVKPLQVCFNISHTYTTVTFLALTTSSLNISTHNEHKHHVCLEKCSMLLKFMIIQ